LCFQFTHLLLSFLTASYLLWEPANCFPVRSWSAQDY